MLCQGVNEGNVLKLGYIRYQGVLKGISSLDMKLTACNPL